MQKLQTLLLIFASVFCFSANAQQPDSIPQQLRVQHEVGVNATMLLKQVLSLSNNTLPTLPYDLTYKRIRGKSALRFGIGVNVDNTKLSRNESSSTIPSPDDVSTFSNSFSTSIRIGWEKRFPLEKRFVVFAGVDIAGGGENSGAQTAFVFNNLPNSYNYQRTTLKSQSVNIGGGPVAGIQFKINKRISLLTEIPVYTFYTTGKSTTTNYSKQLQFNGSYSEITESQTETLTGLNLSIQLPVTLYLVVHFK